MIRVTTVWTGAAGSPWYNTLYFGGTNEGQAQPAAEAARLFWGNCANGVSGAMSGQVLNEVEYVDPATGQVTNVVNTTTAPLEGFATGELLPLATQGLIRLLTASFVNGRRLRGRVFVPAPVEALSTNGAPSATYQGYLADAISDLITGSGGAGGALIYSPTHRVAAPITSGTVWTTNWAVLRSRRD